MCRPIQRSRDRRFSARERNGREARADQAIRKRDRVAEARDHVVELIFGRDRDAGRAAGRESLGEADTSSLLAAAGVTVTGPLVPEIVADESVAVSVCVPAVSSVAVTVATPLVNDTAEKLAPPSVGQRDRVAETGDDVVRGSSAVTVSPNPTPAV